LLLLLFVTKKKGDGKTTVFLRPTGYDNKFEPGGGESNSSVSYTLHVQTGDEMNASTSANVYVEMIGGRRGDESSGRIELTGGKFKRGKSDIITVQTSKLLSPLSKLIVGHDNSGSGPGWFLSRVEVDCPLTGIKQVFPCERWLARDQDDKKIERTLKENTSLREVRDVKCAWTVWVYTSKMKNAGTDARVYMVLYGDKGHTEEIQLRGGGGGGGDGKDRFLFEAGKCDQLNVESKDIGTPYKMRIGHDNKGSAPGWHLERVELEKMQTGERYYFECNRWLAVDEDDGETQREMPAQGPSIKKPLPLVTYIAEVHTGEKQAAGTDADVFLNIFGEFGDTGNRWLRKSQTHRNKFERNNVDVFKLEAVTVKQLKKIRIGHNGKRSGAGWFLKKVSIRQEDNPKYAHTFECNRWLAVDEDDGQIVRELLVDGTPYLDTVSYHVSTKTGDIRGAGTDARVYMRIYGEKGDTGRVRLKRTKDSSKMFERGQIDEFVVESEDLGKIEKIEIGHDGRGVGAGWFLDHVQIEVPAKGLRYMQAKIFIFCCYCCCCFCYCRLYN
jgi:lipoxygenase homology domain-containing protein 1